MSTLIPTRNDNAKTGSEFIETIMNLTGQIREDLILSECLSGNIPNFLRTFAPVTITSGNNSITYLVMPDALSIGNDDDYIRIPTAPGTAQIIANKFDCVMPTKKMVDDIWKASENKILPKPFGAPYDIDIIRTHRYKWINNKINEQMVGKDKSKLTAGGKKNVVLTKDLAPNNLNKRVAIYGWFYANGNVIQGLNAAEHNDTYCDYSHSITLISKDVMVNGVIMNFYDVLNDKNLCKLISDEGNYDARSIY